MRKPVPVISISSDGTIMHYPTMQEAAKHTGINQGAISYAANFGKISHGMRWIREDEYKEIGD